MSGVGWASLPPDRSDRVIVDSELVMPSEYGLTVPKGVSAMRRRIAVLGSALLVVLLGGCAGAGSGAPERGNEATAPPAATTCGTAPVVLHAYFETGFDLPFKLFQE